MSRYIIALQILCHRILCSPKSEHPSSESTLHLSENSHETSGNESCPAVCSNCHPEDKADESIILTIRVNAHIDPELEALHGLPVIYREISNVVVWLLSKGIIPIPTDSSDHNAAEESATACERAGDGEVVPAIDNMTLPCESAFISENGPEVIAKQLTESIERISLCEYFKEEVNPPMIPTAPLLEH